MHAMATDLRSSPKPGREMPHANVTERALGGGLLAGTDLHGDTPAFEFGELVARALDWLSYGVVMIDEGVRPVFANTAAQALIDNGRLPLSRKATLHRADPIEGIRRAVAAFDDAGAHATVACRVGDPPLLCTVAKLPRSSADQTARAILFVTDPKRIRTTRPGDLAGLGLTRAEAAFAVEFANGYRLQVCADRLGISTSTAKTHLKRIFEKTGACRQADLMRLILTLTPALRHDCDGEHQDRGRQQSHDGSEITHG
jgi:DNA-binding CsgD family transcriptional regulator